MSVCVIQDTCTGFLLGGIGELNNKRQRNFLVVKKGKKHEEGERERRREGRERTRDRERERESDVVFV